MAFSVRNLSITIDQINKNKTFRTGDCISGTVHLEVTKEIHIEHFSIKAKGKASVLWSENHGKGNVTVYDDKETCFKSVHYFIQQQRNQERDGYELLTNETGESYPDVVRPGIHVYSFTIQLPHSNMPASFKGYHGKVVYFLEAKLCRSKWIPCKVKESFNYFPLGDMTVPELTKPQYANKEKKMRFFTSGSVTMNIFIEKMAYQLGEELKVRIGVVNNCSRSVKPKFCLYQKQSFFARKKRKLRIKELFKSEGKPIESSTTQTVTQVFKIPTDIPISILNCRVLKVEYKLKVYLDVKFASDPVIKLPVVLFPASETLQATDVASTNDVEFESWAIKQAELNKSTPSNLHFHSNTGIYQPLTEI